MENSQEQKIKEVLTKHIDKIYPSKEALENILKSGEKLTIYWGADPTSQDIHLGHSTNFFVLRRFQNLGHKVIILVGDYTAQIGDPSGLDKSRKVLTEGEVKHNYKTYKKQILKILDSEKTTFRFNSEWWNKISAKRLLELDRLFTHQQVIERDMFQRRINSKMPISFLELQYPLLQGYDSVALKTDVELGATDQLFNMLTGRYLVKHFLKKEKFVITTPLLINPKNNKKLMSKSEGNYVSLQDSPKQMYGKIMALPDSVILTCFRLCTDVDNSRIENMESRFASGENPRNLKSELAFEIVKMYHGEKKAEEARREFNKVFQKHELPKAIPEVTLKAGEYNIVDLLVAAEMAPSKSEARRLVIGRAVKVGGKLINDFKKAVKVSPGLVIQVGKRHFKKLK